MMVYLLVIVMYKRDFNVIQPHRRLLKLITTPRSSSEHKAMYDGRREKSVNTTVEVRGGM